MSIGREAWPTITPVVSTSTALVLLVPWSMARMSRSVGMMNLRIPVGSA